MNQLDQLSSIMSKNTLSTTTKEEVSTKINQLLNFSNYLSTLKDDDHSLTIEINNIRNLLQVEQKSTSRMIVEKNNTLSKDLIKSLTLAKESSMQEIEISQLKLEAELKKLKDEMIYPSTNVKPSFWNKLLKLLKIQFNSKNNELKSRINLANSKINELEAKKETISKDFADSGKESLKYLNKITYNSFLPVTDTSAKNIESLKSKITVLN